MEQAEAILKQTSGLESHLKVAADGEREVMAALRPKVQPFQPEELTAEDVALVLTFSHVPQLIAALQSVEASEIECVNNQVLKGLGVVDRVARKRALHGLKCLVQGVFLSEEHEDECAMCAARSVEQTQALLEEHKVPLAGALLEKHQLTMGPLLYCNAKDLMELFELQLMPAARICKQLKKMKKMHVSCLPQ